MQVWNVLLRIAGIATSLVGSAYAAEGNFDWSDSCVQALASGIDHIAIAVDSPAPLNINAVRVDTRTEGLRFTTTQRCADWTENARETEREPAREFIREANEAGMPVVVAINADAFSPWPAPWNEPTVTNLLGLAVSDGLLVSPASGSPSFLAYVDGRVSLATTTPETDLKEVRTAISGFAFCLQSGEPLESGEDLHPRSGLGLCEEARYLYLLAIDGRRRSSIGVTTEELGRWLRHFGAHNGINLDGGGSTTLVRWNPSDAGNGPVQVLNRPVGNGVDWRDKPPLFEKMLGQPVERFNGNHLGVLVATPESR